MTRDVASHLVAGVSQHRAGLVVTKCATRTVSAGVLVLTEGDIVTISTFASVIPAASHISLLASAGVSAAVIGGRFRLFDILVLATIGLGVVVLVLAGVVKPENGGMASGWALWRRASLHNARLRAKTTRPSMTWWDRHRPWIDRGQVGITLGRTVARPWQRLYALFEDSFLVIASPGMGKDSWVGNAIIDWPGAVLFVTSKVQDLIDHMQLRSLRGPVLLLNLERADGWPSSLRISPVAGCEDPEVADWHAGWLLMGSKDKRGTGQDGAAKFFNDGAHQLLKVLLIAAAVSGKTLVDVYRWACQETNNEPLEILHGSGDPRYEAQINELHAVLDAHDLRTTSNTYRTLGNLLSCMGVPSIAALVDVPADEGTFDVEAFLASGATLYVIGSERESGATTPIVTWLSEYIVAGARRVAVSMPKQRLDPPLLMVFNEVGKIVPVRVDVYLAELRRYGIVTVAMAQSYSQLVARWEIEGAKVIRDSSRVEPICGGPSDADYLTAVSTAMGTYTTKAPLQPGQKTGWFGSKHGEQVHQTMTPGEIRVQREYHFTIMRSGMKPVRARFRPAWRRRDVKAAHKRYGNDLPPLYAGVNAVQVSAVHAAMADRKRQKWQRWETYLPALQAPRTGRPVTVPPPDSRTGDRTGDRTDSRAGSRPGDGPNGVQGAPPSFGGRNLRDDVRDSVREKPWMK